ncbi:MAG: MBL fold metallo-hydrolase [Candidatus Zixiibacteriota bacterium]|nr:MAG: MBL fold metallo-hydrolase [candidate division Zixibacteria bacterium]
MIKCDSNLVVILMSFVLLLIAGARQEGFPVTAGSYPEQEPAGSSLPVKQPEGGDSLTLTYIANMGVLVNSADSKVMIDCLFGELNRSRYPAPETLDSMVKGIPPFDNIDLVLVTHKDPDHFNSAIVSRYMETRPEPILIAPTDAVKEMRKVANDWSRIESRIISIDLEVGEEVKKEVAGIPLTIVPTLHLDDKTPMNLMYLIGINDWRIFHQGDLGKPDDFLKFGLEAAPVDLAVVGYAWPLSPNPVYPRFLQVLKPRHIALGHVSTVIESVAEERINQVRKYYDDIFVLLPGMPTKVFRRYND